MYGERFRSKTNAKTRRLAPKEKEETMLIGLSHLSLLSGGE
jgi:hypothetical protein